MSQNQEIIESKLCAYIDGELDAEGRTEIEKHLDANPQHRRLLESLKATRDLIKWLPREPAPTELAETLNGQLERSVLLDFDERSLKRNIWPRVFTAAAIIALTAGLATAVYFTLPKGQRRATPYAARSSDTSPSPMPDANLPEPPPDVTKGEDALVAAGTMAKNTATTLSSGKPIEEEKQADAELDRFANDISQNQAAIMAVANNSSVGQVQFGQNQLAQNQSASNPTAANAMMMLVRADSPERATRDVTNYLQSQKIVWRNAASGMGLSQQATQPSRAAALREAMVSQGDIRRDVLRQSQSAPPTTQPSAIGRTPREIDAQGQPNWYFARMSRQQVVDLSNSVQQGSSRKAEVKDLDLSASASDPQSRSISVAASALPPIAPSTEPATLPAEVPQSLAAGVGGGFARGGAGLAASQPASTAPSEQPVNVVIVVQSESSATEPATTQPGWPNMASPAATPVSPASQPATQPTTAQ